MESAILWEPGSSEESTRTAQGVPGIAGRVRAHECSTSKKSFQLRKKNAAWKFWSWKFPRQKGIQMRRVGGREKRKFVKSHSFKSSRTSYGCGRLVRSIPCRFICPKGSNFTRIWTRRDWLAFGGRLSSSTINWASVKEEKVEEEACSQELRAASRCLKYSKRTAREHVAINDWTRERSQVARPWLAHCAATAWLSAKALCWHW